VDLASGRRSPLWTFTDGWWPRPARAVSRQHGESITDLEVAVLGVWAALGLTLAPILLRRMTRRESGSRVAQRREQALQRIG
jgi:ABC-2 type transport system permease protein